MENLKQNLLEKIKNTAIYVSNNIEILIVTCLIFLSPFIVNYADLPKGYEIPKVAFLQVGTIILVAIFIVKELYLLFGANRLKLDKNLIWPLLLIFFIIISTLTSPFQNIAVYGNQFRFQGAITHVLMVLFTYIVFRKGNKDSAKLILWAFFMSSIIQGIVSVGQLKYFVLNNPKAIFEGYYINGTFGQANFYSGRILLGILSGIFLVSMGVNYTEGKKRILKVIENILHFLVIPLLILFLIFSLIISFSTWGIITAGIMVFTLIIYEVFHTFSSEKKRNYFGYMFGILCFLGIIIGAVLLNKYSSSEYNIRVDIWNKILSITSSDSLLRVMIGYGYDTLGEVFRRAGAFSGLYVDRAHNFFLDIYSQGGLITFIISALLLIWSFTKFVFKKSDRILVYFFFGMFFWLFRSFIHESGIVNLFDFLVLFGITLSLQKGAKIDLKLSRFIPKRSHKSE